jgi:hypothetical protein
MASTKRAFPEGRPEIVPPQQRPVLGNEVRSGRWEAVDSAGKPLVSVGLDKEEARLRWPKGQLLGELRGGSRRYVDAPGAKSFVSKVKRRGPIAVLRGPTGAVQWRVMLGQQGIRYWRGDETGEPTYQISGGELRRGGELVGRLRREGGTTLVTDAGGAVVGRIESESESQAWAALLFEDLPEAERFILVAEVLIRGR